MKAYWKAYFAIRRSIREGKANASDVEAFGTRYGFGADYRYLRQLASEFQQLAQAA
jgi:hypothetical protein